MKKVLVIANIFHSSPRIPGMVSYLNEFGWAPTFITVPFGNVENMSLPAKFKEVDIIPVPFSGDIFTPIRNILKAFNVAQNQSERVVDQTLKTTRPILFSFEHILHTLFAYPDTEITWIKPALKVINRLNLKEFDCILSSSPHPTVHIIASKIHKDISWVADFRDPWTQNHVYPYNYLRKYFERKLEIKTIESACFLTGATETMSKKQFNLHNKLYKIIYNGFDYVNKVPLLNKFTISYTGTIYNGKQNPEKFLAVLKELLVSKLINNVQVRFYGKKNTYLQSIIDKLGLNSIVTQYGVLKRSEILDRQSESHALLMFNWEDESEKSVCPLKFFEYLASSRPILATGGTNGDEIENIIDKTNCGYYVCTYKEIRTALLQLHTNYMWGKNDYNGISSEIEKYSFRNMARQFAEIFNEVSK
jgi:glycosyltransferase involved in cell wall biosynthesis